MLEGFRAYEFKARVRLMFLNVLRSTGACAHKSLRLVKKCENVRDLNKPMSQTSYATWILVWLAGAMDAC